MKMEKEFLEKLAEAYQTYDSSVIENYLADDLYYTSFYVFQEINSKTEYLEYLNGKLQTLKRHGIKMEYEVVKGKRNEYALLVTNQKGPDGTPFGFVADIDEKGLIKSLEITIKPFF